jgi:CheY-like chemotaxis protein
MPSQKQDSRKDSRKDGRKTLAQSRQKAQEMVETPGRQVVGGGALHPSLLGGHLRKKTQPGAQVLVVDDEVVVRRVITDYLEGKGYSVTAVDSGQAALDYLQQNSPGIVLLDIFMPGVNGLEVLRQVKRGQPGVDVLVISGFADAELERKVRALGAIDCLRKPFDFNTLHTLVAQRLGKSER